jgi:hypothetical protein
LAQRLRLTEAAMASGRFEATLAPSGGAVADAKAPLVHIVAPKVLLESLDWLAVMQRKTKSLQ